ncbi:MAG: hypothetical protein HYX69_00475 [Planctomycetia bacterium]|nr:hypothetical protein [Planctomycetia bacterium]
MSHYERAGTGRALLFVLIIAVVSFAAIAWWISGRGGSEDNGPTPEQVKKLSEEAYQLQSSKDWRSARDKLDELITLVDGHRRYDDVASEARRNRDLVQQQCQLDPVKGSVDVPSTDGDRPGKVPEDELIAAYPVGRTVESSAILTAEGSGTNKEWIFKGYVNFVYQYWTVVETRVVENRGTAVVFEQYFKQIRQVRADRVGQIELHMPESPFLELIVGEADEELRGIPRYALVRRLAQIANTFDPRLRKTLTTVSQWLGADQWPDEDFEIVAQIEKLQGLKVRLEYVTGLGVVKAEPSNDVPISRADLLELAKNAALLADYFVSKATEVKPGETYTVRAEDIGGILNLGHQPRLSGQFDLRRRERDTDQSPDITTMDVVGGAVDVATEVYGVRRSATIKRKAGRIRYSTADRMVQHAEMEWEAQSAYLSTNHLLFGTERVKNLTMKSLYEARPGASTPSEVKK